MTHPLRAEPASDGWHYQGHPDDGDDCRKIVTLQEHGMVWVGIRAWAGTHWVNNGEPERAEVLAWRDLPAPGQKRWIRGQLV